MQQPTKRTVALALMILAGSVSARADLSPAAAGWGNLLVPGLGATLRGQPGRGLIEASLEIGTYYGGTFGINEGSFTIDGTVRFPTQGNLYNPIAGQVLQEFGLKLHMDDTFYHYQQLAIEQADSERERSNPQKIYRGTWLDILSAPFKPKNLSSIWVWPVLLGTAVVQLSTYSQVDNLPSIASQPGTAESLYGLTTMGILPLGSSFGEEALFRGFIQREMRGYTAGMGEVSSLGLSILSQDILFAAIHPPELRPYAIPGGIYWGLMVHFMDGDLEPAIAEHFWNDVINGLVTYWLFQRAQGKNTPFAPPIAASIKIQF